MFSAFVSPRLAALIAEARHLALDSATASLDMRVDMFEGWAEQRRRAQEEISQQIWQRAEAWEEPGL